MSTTDILDETNDFLSKSEVSVEDNFKLLRSLSSKLDKEPNDVRDAVIRVLDKWDKIPSQFHDAWTNLVEAVGLYPYMTINQEILKGSSAIRYEFHRSPNLKDIVFHSEQQKVWHTLANKKSTILSAPTSFGKSLLIEQIIASNKYKNIVIVQPTLALLDETRNKLTKYNDKYNLILSTAEKPTERNIFLLTAERVVEYEDLPDIDFFVIDEFYKLSSERDDERSTALNVAVYKLLKKTQNFYFLGPNIYKIPEGFTSKFNSEWIKSDFTTVAADTQKITGARGGMITSAKTREEELFKLLETFDDQTLIYCSKPKRAVDLAHKFSLFLKNNVQKQEEITEINEWVQENIHKDWSLINSLSKGVAFHHGSIPRHLGVSIIDLFNNKKIKYLFCTSTIIEGVNTSAKNVVLFDAKKGMKPIDYFDFKNISGRSGRMQEHFVGKIYQFHEQPEETELEIDIPFFTQTNAPLELLIHLDETDLKPNSIEKMAALKKLTDEERILLKSNFGAPLEGQIAVLKMLKEDDGTLHSLLNWRNYPTWEQLSKSVEICFNHLIFKKRGNFTSKQLALKVSKFIHLKNIKSLIDEDIVSEYNINKYPDYQKRVQNSVEANLYLLRNWFTFILPKSLGILNELQQFVFEKKNLPFGNYLAVIHAIENKHVQDNLAPLLDYSVPTSALKKIARYIDPESNFEMVMERISTLDLSKIDLLDYERKSIKRAIKQTKNLDNLKN